MGFNFYKYDSSTDVTFIELYEQAVEKLSIGSSAYTPESIDSAIDQLNKFLPQLLLLLSDNRAPYGDWAKHITYLTSKLGYIKYPIPYYVQDITNLVLKNTIRSLDGTPTDIAGEVIGNLFDNNPDTFVSISRNDVIEYEFNNATRINYVGVHFKDPQDIANGFTPEYISIEVQIDSLSYKEVLISKLKPNYEDIYWFELPFSVDISNIKIQIRSDSTLNTDKIAINELYLTTYNSENLYLEKIPRNDYLEIRTLSSKAIPNVYYFSSQKDKHLYVYPVTSTAVAFDGLRCPIYELSYIKHIAEITAITDTLEIPFEFQSICLTFLSYAIASKQKLDANIAALYKSELNEIMFPLSTNMRDRSNITIN